MRHATSLQRPCGRHPFDGRCFGGGAEFWARRSTPRRYKDRAGDIPLMFGVLGAVRCFWGRCGVFGMRCGVLGRDAVFCGATRHATSLQRPCGRHPFDDRCFGGGAEFWARRGTPRRYKKYSVDRGLYTSARIERKNAPQPPCTQAVELFPILGLFGGLSSRRGRL